MRKPAAGLFFILILFLQAKAQYYDIGQEAASVKWLSIETANFQFIFPETYSEQAKLAVRQFDLHAPLAIENWKVNPKKTPIVFHPNYAGSNAYAAWAPRRVEILTTPPQDLYAQPWMEQLALHEYRHIVQLSRLDRNVIKFLGNIFGQQVVPAAAGVFLPTWFIEGDAVVAETALSNSGRGRVPSFAMPLRAQLLEKKAYSYAKASLGSYRDFVPDVYTLGYHIIAASNLSYGLRPWEASMDAIARLKLFTPFNSGLKKSTGSNKHQLYHEAMVKLNNLWKPVSVNKENFLLLDMHSESYASVTSVAMLNDSVCAYLQGSLDKTPKIYHLNLKTGSKKTIHTPGYISGNWIDGNNNNLVWTENRPHERWQMKSYNDLVIYNDSTATTRRLALRKKLYSPVFNGDGDRILAIEYTPQGNPELLILSGKSTQNYSLPDTLHPATPAWGRDENDVLWIATSTKGKSIASTNLINGQTELIKDFGTREINTLKIYNHNLYCLIDCEGVMQLCRIGKGNEVSQQLTESTYGVGDYTFYKDSILYTSYTADGYRLAITPNRYKGEIPEAFDWLLAQALSDTMGKPRASHITGENEYIIKPYRKGSHLFNVHSWGPLYIDAGNEKVNPGVSIMSQNILSTLFVTAGYDYDLFEREGRYRLEATWKGWYPEISLEASNGNRYGSYLDKRNYLWDLNWNETQVNLNFRIPFNFSRGALNRGIVPNFDISQTRIKYNGSKPENLFEGSYIGFSYSLFAYSYQRMAHRDLAPRLGINAKFTYRHSPFGDISLGHISGFETQIFLPGIGRNHSISTYLAFQELKRGNYIFNNVVGISRGYHRLQVSRKLLSGRFNYALPLFYPDLEIKNLIYIKRIRANVFADVSILKPDFSYISYNSMGADLVIDFHGLNLPPQMSLGMRSIYLTTFDEWRFELLLSINLYDF